MKNILRLFFILTTILILFTIIKCIDNKNLDEVDLLLFEIYNKEKSYKNSCMQWAYSEWDCVNDNSKEKFIILECSWNGIYKNPINLGITELNEINFNSFFPCLKICNQEYNLSIQCPNKIQYSTIQEYRKSRNHGNSIFALNWQSCRDMCLGK